MLYNKINIQKSVEFPDPINEYLTSKIKNTHTHTIPSSLGARRVSSRLKHPEHRRQAPAHPRSLEGDF